MAPLINFIAKSFLLIFAIFPHWFAYAKPHPQRYRFTPTNVFYKKIPTYRKVERILQRPPVYLSPRGGFAMFALSILYSGIPTNN